MSTTFWDNRAVQYDRHIQKHEGQYNDDILRTTELLSSEDVVLEIGCASGEYSLDWAPHVQQIQAIDSSAKMVELAQQKAIERQVDNVTFVQAEVTDPSFDGTSFSAVVAFNVFHLVEDLAGTIARIGELVPVGGLLISQTPCLGERGLLLRASLWVAGKFGLIPTVLSLTATQLEQNIKEANFEIVESQIWDESGRVHWIVAKRL